jgi:hypothetical protein
MDLTPKHTFFHAMCIRPAVRFESQAEGEEVILLVRAHPFTQFIWIFNTFALFFILTVINFFLNRLFPLNYILFANIAGIIGIFVYAWANFIHWFFNVGIVTNVRIIDVDVHNSLYKEITATKLERVSEATSKIGGFFGSLFQYGTVFVKTEGTRPDIEFERIPQPTQVVNIINNLMHT